MSKNRLKGARDKYDSIVIGSGLAGMTAANMLAKAGHSVLLLEQHYNFGGLATWFKRKGGHILDISLHGFPIGMIKTCRKYWNKEIADSIVHLKNIRFDNPQFSFTTTFDKLDFTRVLRDRFGVFKDVIDEFFGTVRSMNFYDNLTMTTRDLFEKFFPGRTDIHRLLIEPITYANGSTLDDPAITYGIVFSNFMDKGVYTFKGGTDALVRKMKQELTKNGVDLRNHCQVDKILVKNKQTRGVVVNGREIECDSVLSNSSLLATIHKLAGNENFSPEFLREVKKVRLSNSSCQVYIGIEKGAKIENVGDLLFTSKAGKYDPTALCSKNVTSRTFSFYYPELRPGSNRYTIVSSTNANYNDWANLNESEYQKAKDYLIKDTLDALEKYIPDIRQKVDYLEAATPQTFKRYTMHLKGASFGTKFEGLQISRDLPKQIAGLFHAGSVGIIMSGWLGAANYGVIVANEVDRFLRKVKEEKELEAVGFS